jgi:hypothetical protein
MKVSDLNPRRVAGDSLLDKLVDMKSEIKPELAMTIAR